MHLILQFLSSSVTFVLAWNLTTSFSLNDVDSLFLQGSFQTVDKTQNHLVDALRSRNILSNDHKSLQQVHLGCVGKEAALTEKLAAVEREKEDLLDKNIDQEE
ncbi:hypothetical protein Tco_1128328 [Tanacetum coccineum]